MRILLTSIGRRGYLVEYFRQALGADGQIWGGDNDKYAPALHFCHQSMLLPEITGTDYIDRLMALCKENQIDMVVPLIDPELEVLARRRQEFYDMGIMAVISPPETVEIAFDKYLTYRFGKDNGIAVPETTVTIDDAQRLFAEGTLKWPVVVKPRKGSASANITYCKNQAQLRFAFANAPNPMIQQYVNGTEYGYDIFCDRSYRPITVFCKRKLLMRAGETDKAVSVNDAQLTEFGLKLAECMKIFGPVDVDVMCDSDGPKLLEINPRFGGGYPCAHLCGADFPEKLIALCRNKTLTPETNSYPAGIYMLKQDQIISPTAENLKSVKNWRPSVSDSQ